MKTKLLCWLFLIIVLAAIGQCSEVQQPSAVDDYCDDVEIVKDVLSYECLQLCLIRRWCTHYTWRRGNTCYLKKRKKRKHQLEYDFCNNAGNSFMKTNFYCCLLCVSYFSWICMLQIWDCNCWIVCNSTSNPNRILIEKKNFWWSPTSLTFPSPSNYDCLHIRPIYLRIFSKYITHLLLKQCITPF